MIETFFMVSGIVVWAFVVITLWPLLPLVPMLIVGITIKHAVNLFEEWTLPDEREEIDAVIEARKERGSWLWKIGHGMVWIKYKNWAIAEFYMDTMEKYYYKYVPFPL